MKADIKHHIKLFISYLYLTIGYAFIIYDFSYSVRTAAKPIGWGMLIIFTFGYYSIYVLINHLIIKKIVADKILNVIDLLLFLSLITLIWSDIMFENR